MILFDTDIWIWWGNGNRQLKTWQIIVATARIHDVFLLTVDSKILNYEHVKTFEKPDP